jgi:AcrR family transcriptional regulator
LDLFGTRGFVDVRVKDICGAAGLTERYFYENFKNLEELFDVLITELAEEGYRLFQSAMREAQKSHPEDIRAWLNACISSAVEFVTADPRRIRVGFVETITVKGHGDGRRTLNAFGEAELAQMIPRIASATSLSVDDARLRIIALVGAGNELLIAWAEGRLPTDPPRIVEFMTDMCLAGTSLSGDRPARPRRRPSRLAGTP